MARFGRVLTAMVTPFAADGSLNIDAAVSLAKRLVREGNDGLVVAGTTGESATLTDPERLELIEAVANAVTAPVVAGTTTNDTPHSIHLTKEASRLGAAGVLAVTPYYNRPSQAGIRAHFEAVAGATDLPVMLYDIPIRSGRKIDHDVIVSLSRDVSNIVALKDAAARPDATALVIGSVPQGFEVYSGDDAMTLPLLAVGAVGVVGVATAWCAKEVGDMIQAFNDGDHRKARLLNLTCSPSFKFEASLEAPNPVPAKAMLRTLGESVGECRLPMGPTPAGLEDQARDVYSRLTQFRDKEGI